MNICSSKKQTKEWRQSQIWYNKGKNNKCEKFQLNILKEHKKHFKYIQTHTNIRINYETNELEIIKKPLDNLNGFEYSEDFDGYFKINSKKYHINLKMVCSNGGAQTRTLREVYHFIKAQIKLIQKYKNLYFINILDGDQSYKHLSKFNYLIVKNKLSKDEQKQIFIGDLYTYLNKIDL